MKSGFDYCFYHYPCTDGFTCSFIVEHFSEITTKHVGLNVREPFPEALFQEIKKKRVIMCDIAFDRETMIKIHKACEYFICIDHHQTNQKNLEDLDFVVFDMSQAACQMVWRYFNHTPGIPFFIDAIGLRDTWKHQQNERALFFTNALSDKLLNFKSFTKMLEDPNYVESLIQEGKILFENHLEICRQISNTAVLSPKKFHGFNVHVVNTHYPFISDVSDIILKNFPNDIVLCWYKQFNKPYTYSLRSASDNVDVAYLCERYLKNGGGHSKAAGFASKQSPEEILRY
jgi:oligoribonuclease NrnB/cAMP/cGMP phosphodiesterase (DHH superfamily)